MWILFFRQIYSTKTFVIPVVLFATLYNVPSFFHTQLYEKRMAWNGTHFYEVNETAVMDDNVTLVLEFGPTELRKNPYYIRIYIQYMNIIFNQIGPFLLLGVLNFKGEWIKGCTLLCFLKIVKAAAKVMNLS